MLAPEMQCMPICRLRSQLAARFVYLIAIIAFTFPVLTIAQQVPTAPTSSHIFPAGGQRGTKVAVRVGGECLPPLTRFRIFGDGLQSPEMLGPKSNSHSEPSPRRKPGEVHIYYPKEWEHSIEIAPDAALGMYLWRLSTASGGTGGRPFIVGDLPEHIESESNSSLEQAEPVNIPITINGQIDGERDLDYFSFDVAANEIVTVDLVSRRLGSPLEAVVELFDESGRRVPTSVYRAGSDPVVTMRAPQTGRYRLMLGHLGFQGGPQFTYRATVSTTPYIPFVFPTSGKAGTTSVYDVSKLCENGVSEPFPLEISIPENAASGQRARIGTESLNAIEIETSDLPNQLEQEANNTVAEAQAISLPCNLQGRFLEADDEDWFRFEARQGALWSFECQRFPLGGDCLPIITITNADGTPLASANSADDPRLPCRIQWRAPADGTFALRMRDVQQGARGGWDFIYRIRIAPASPGFELHTAADFVNVVQGSKAELEVKVLRAGDFAGAVDLQIDGLPDGLRCESNSIPPGQNAVKLTLVADDNARSCDRMLKIRGTGTHEGTPLAAYVQASHLGRDSDGVSLGSPSVDHLQLTVRPKPAVRLFCNEAYQYAYRGSVYPYSMEIERLNGFTGPVRIELADRQIKDLDGIVVHEVTVEPGQTRFELPIYLPESMHINVQAHSNVYAQAYVHFEDPSGQKLSQLFVSEMRCMIRPLPAVAKLSAVENELRVASGETVRCQLRLERTSLFQGAMSVELVDPTSESGIVATPLIFKPEDSIATMSVKLPGERKFTAPIELRFRATGELPGYQKIVSETTVRVRPVDSHQPD